MASMGELEKQMLQAPCSITLYDNKEVRHNHWVIMEGDDDDTYNTTISPTTSSFENSATSNGSSSSSDLVDDASSSTSSNGPLYELSDLMAQLPIKRGLSKYFEGKSQSFTSLSRVMSIEDLAKKETPYRKKLKACKSYGGVLDAHKSCTLPKATISKKASRSSLLSLSNRSRRGSFLGNCRPPPPIPALNNLQC